MAGVRIYLILLVLILAFVPTIGSAVLWYSLNLHSGGVVERPSTIIVDSYAEGNYDITLGPIATFHPSNTWDLDSAESQSFMGAASKIIGAGFYLRRFGAPSGQLQAVLYSQTGAFGNDSRPDAELARSDPVESSTLSSSFGIVVFTFSGTEQVALAANTPYCVVLEGPKSGLLDSANNIQIGGDFNAPSHSGSYARYRNNAWWSIANVDMIFYVYGNGIIPATIHGRVAHSDGTTAFNGAKVELVGYSTLTTGIDGNYSFSSVPARSYILRFSASGYQIVEQTVDATSGGDFHVSDARMSALPQSRVYGYVKYLNSSPAADVSVRVIGDSTYVETTNNDGLYTFAGIPHGNYQLQATVADYRQLGAWTVRVNADLQKNVTLVPRSPVGGKLPIPLDGQVYHMAFCSWGDTAAPLPNAGRQDIDRFVSIVGKSLYGAENAGTITVGEDFWTMSGPNSWKPLLDEGRFEVFIFSLNPYLRAYPSDLDPVNGPSAIEWKIANGEYDAWINVLAQQCKNFNYTIMLKIGVEMNGNQGSNGPGSWVADYGANPAAFVAAWKRIVDVFGTAGVTNVNWLISYTFESIGMYSFEDYYPGDAYVDWIGVDYYQISASDNPSSQVAAFYNWAILKNKPLAVTEWGTNWYNKNISDADRARYMNDFFDDLETKPEFKMIRYHWNSWWRFQDDDPLDYGYMPLASSTYRNRIANDRYLEYLP